jgi:ADP-heptose:LPS heptosyltransferase
MENTLIIKTGAIGDVVRTTSLLNVIAGNIYWITGQRKQTIISWGYSGLKCFVIG